MGGIQAFVKPGQKVLLKPNLLGAAAPEKCHTTHPALVKAVGALVQQAGGRLWIGDSPAIDSFKRVARICGMSPDRPGAGGRAFRAEPAHPGEQPGGGPYSGVWRSPKQVLEADVVINLPKLKTHGPDADDPWG